MSKLDHTPSIENIEVSVQIRVRIVGLGLDIGIQGFNRKIGDTKNMR